MERNSTDLPEPDPPTMPNTSPRSTVMSRWSCALLGAKPEHPASMSFGHRCPAPERRWRTSHGKNDQEDRLHAEAEVRRPSSQRITYQGRDGCRGATAAEDRRLDGHPERGWAMAPWTRSRYSTSGMSSSHLHSKAPLVSPMPSAITASSGMATTRPITRGGSGLAARRRWHAGRRLPHSASWRRSRRRSAARTAGNDDGGEQHAELAQHPGHDIDHEDFRAVFARLLGGDVGNDQRDEKLIRETMGMAVMPVS